DAFDVDCRLLERWSAARQETVKDAHTLRVTPASRWRKYAQYGCSAAARSEAPAASGAAGAAALRELR
ncbi:MAG: hypothetical protein QOF29_2766, partial [bacterium]